MLSETPYDTYYAGFRLPIARISRETSFAEHPKTNIRDVVYSVRTESESRANASASGADECWLVH